MLVHTRTARCRVCVEQVSTYKRHQTVTAHISYFYVCFSLEIKRVLTPFIPWSSISNVVTVHLRCIQNKYSHGFDCVSYTSRSCQWQCYLPRQLAYWSSCQLQARTDRNQWRIQRGRGDYGRTMAIEILVHLTSVMSLWTYQSSLVTENGHIWQLHQYCENGLQMENKSLEILHHLGTQKDAKLCLKCTKIRLAAEPGSAGGALALPQTL